MSQCVMELNCVNVAEGIEVLVAVKNPDCPRNSVLNGAPGVPGIFIYIGETLVSLNWALVNDILLYVVIPTRRSSALAIQILMAHALGDAGSPYIVGLIADGFLLYFGHKDFVTDYSSLQFALYMTCFVCVIGGGFFLATAIYVEDDRNKANLATHGVTVTPSAAESSVLKEKPTTQTDISLPTDAFS